MAKHEEKTCPRCQLDFVCKVGDISHCACYLITLSLQDREQIQQAFGDCLCGRCLQALVQSHQLIVEKESNHGR